MSSRSKHWPPEVCFLLALLVLVALLVAGCGTVNAPDIARAVAEALTPTLEQIEGLTPDERTALVAAVSKAIEGQLSASSEWWRPVAGTLVGAIGTWLGLGKLTKQQAIAEVNAQRDGARRARGEQV